MYQDSDKDKIVKHTMYRYAYKLKMWTQRVYLR